MAEEFIVNFFGDLLESLEDAQAEPPRQRASVLRDPFELSNAEFIKHFRLTKALTVELIQLIEPVIVQRSQIDIKTKVLCALHFFGTGSYQTPTAKLFCLNISQPSASRCISEVVEALNHPNIFNSLIRFPNTLEELQNISRRFYSLYGFPGIVGCIDCTHISIVPPQRPFEERSYVNRKNYHSINTQLICDANLKILNVNALFPGSTHDSYIWNSSNVLPVMEQLHLSNQSYHLIELSASIKREKIVEICEGCGQKIQDRYLMRVGELSWHEHCLSCCVCGCPLAHTCYTRNAKLYCKPDYDRLFGVKCTRCGDRLLPQEMVMRAQQYVFHIQCFVCVMCCQPLQKGEQYVIRAGQIFCRQDFEKEMYLMQHAEDDMIIDDSDRPRDGRRGPKRPRTILTSAQRRQFKASFEVSPKPCRKVREALAKDTGLSVRVVQVWFQNQRAKMKKIQRKAKQEGDKNTEKEKDKDEKSIKQESPSSEHGNYLGLDGSYSASSQPLNPNLPYSPDDYPAHSGDSFCSSDISLDGSNFDQLDEGASDTMSLQNLEVQHHPHQHSGHQGHEPLNLGTGAVVNPIDKLYLMQNSYFSTDH